MNGNIPELLNEQICNTFKNIKSVLNSQGLTSDDVIKVNIWATEEIDWDFFDEQWETLSGQIYPSMAIAYVKALGLPELKIEIDIWGAKQ